MWEFFSHSDKLLSFLLAFFAICGVIYKGCRSITLSLRGLHATIQEIKKEVRPNGGSSLRDAVTRTEAGIERLDGNQKRIMVAVEHLRSETAADFSMDEKPRWEADARGSLTRVNAALRALGGRDEWELLGANWKNCIHSEDVARMTREWAQAVSDGRYFQCDFRMVTRDGRAELVRSAAQVMKNDGGEVLGWQGYIRELETN